MEVKNMAVAIIENDAYERKEYTTERARKNCILSLILRYGVPVMHVVSVYAFMLIAGLFSSYMFDTSMFATVSFAAQLICYVISWYLMCDVRKNRRDYEFGKVLKYLYIIDTTLLVIFCIFGTYSVFYTLAHFMK